MLEEIRRKASDINHHVTEARLWVTAIRENINRITPENQEDTLNRVDEMVAKVADNLARIHRPE